MVFNCKLCIEHLSGREQKSNKFDKNVGKKFGNKFDKKYWKKPWNYMFEELDSRKIETTTTTKRQGGCIAEHQHRFALAIVPFFCCFTTKLIYFH